MFSIKSKIILSYSILFGIVLIMFASIVYKTIEINSYDKVSSSLRNYSRFVLNELTEEIERGEKIDINKIHPLRGSGLYDIKIQLYDTCGNLCFGDSTVVTSTDEYCKLASQKKILLQNISINNQNYLSLWKAVRIKHQIIYIAQIAASLQETESNLNNIFLTLIILIPLSLAIMAAAAYFISKASFKPILNMAKTADEITIHNLSTRLELPKPNDEVKSLGNTLNNMISRIESSVKSQRQFIANASHEFRTPLTVIQTELELAEKKLVSLSAIFAGMKNSSEEETLEYISDSLKIALAEIENLNKFTNDLLTIAKLDSSQVPVRTQKFRIDELLLECIQNLNLLAKNKNININLLENEPNEISADRDKIKSIILNLIDNAIKYTELPEDNQEREISVELKKENAKIILTVEDSGIGISESDLLNIFNRFFRSNEIRSKEYGNGLGLSIVKDFVEMHNGNIEVESVLGKGTKFIVKLPA
jgi:signal transduction histidine kinase